MDEATLLVQYEPFLRKIVNKHYATAGIITYNDYEDRMQIASMAFLKFIRRHGEDKATASWARIYNALNNYLIQMASPVYIPRNKFFPVFAQYQKQPLDTAECMTVDSNFVDATCTKIMVEGAIKTLDEDEQAIAMGYMQGMKLSEISHRLGYTGKTTVYKKMQSIRQKFQKYYGAEAV